MCDKAAFERRGIATGSKLPYSTLRLSPRDTLPFGFELPFCKLTADRIWIETEDAVAFPDAYPVTDGHTLVVPRKHVSTIYELTLSEQQAIWALVSEVRSRLLTGLKPAGFNIGFNDGIDAGQTVEHAQIHVISRRAGDVPDPRGGIRWVVAENAPYWKKSMTAPSPGKQIR